MSVVNDIIRQLKEEEERKEAEVKACKENEAKLKELQKEIKDFEADFEELKKENRELRKELAEKEIKVDFMQQQKNMWNEIVNKNRTKIKEQEDNLEEFQQKIWKDRISFCDMVDEFTKKHDLMAMYRGEMFPDEQMDAAVSNVKMKSVLENQLDGSSSNSSLTKNTDLASRPHLENIMSHRVNKNETATLANKQKAGQIKHIRDNVAELEKEMFSVANEAEALHKFKQSTINKFQSQDYDLKYKSPYFKLEATRIPSTVVSSSTKNINDTCDITQSYCTYRDYQPGPSSAFKTDAQKFTRTNYSTNTGNKSSPTCNKPASDNNNSSTNKMKEFSSHEKKFVPKVPSSTLRSNTANIQRKPQVFKFSLSNQSNINL